MEKYFLLQMNKKTQPTKQKKHFKTKKNIPKSDFFVRETRADNWITEEMRKVDIIYLS